MYYSQVVDSSVYLWYIISHMNENSDTSSFHSRVVLIFRPPAPILITNSPRARSLTRRIFRGTARDIYIWQDRAGAWLGIKDARVWKAVRSHVLDRRERFSMERRCGCLRPVSRARVAKGAKIAREKKSQERVSGRQRQSLKILLKMKRAHGEGETKRWRESSVVVEVRKRRKIDNMKYCFTPHKSWCRFMGIEIPGRGKSLFVERVPKVSFHHVRVARSLSWNIDKFQHALSISCGAWLHSWSCRCRSSMVIRS